MHLCGRYTYLDTHGRPVLVLRLTNTVDSHGGPFTVPVAVPMQRTLGLRNLLQWWHATALALARTMVINMGSLTVLATVVTTLLPLLRLIVALTPILRVTGGKTSINVTMGPMYRWTSPAVLGHIHLPIQSHIPAG
jgi:hypothetical protein